MAEAKYQDNDRDILFPGDDPDLVEVDQISSGVNNVKPALGEDNHRASDNAALVMQDKHGIMEELKEQRALIMDLRKQLQEHKSGLSLSQRSSFKQVPGKSYLPNDIYSFFVCSKLCSHAFFFAIIVFSFQIIIYLLLAKNQYTFDSVNNPLNYPPNVEIIVRVTQFICILIAVLTQDDLREALEQAREGYNSESLENAFDHASCWKFWLSCVLRFIQGTFGLLVTLFLIIRVDNVIDLLLNFTAMEFVSQLDNVAFQLASVNFFGGTLQETCELILDTSYDVPKNQEARQSNHSFLLLTLVFAAMLSGWATVVYKQTHSQFLCKAIFVQFGDTASAELGAYTGVYKLENSMGRNDQRVRYVKHHNFKNSSGSFGYCIKEEAWTYFLKGEDVCDGILAKSSVTRTFDILETESSPWDVIVPFSAHGIEIEQFQMTCVESDGTETKRCESDLCMDDCSDDTCMKGCNNNSYGVFCTDINSDDNSIEPPCRTLEFGFDRFSSYLSDDSDDIAAENSLEPAKFRIFEDTNTSFQVYYNPVYVPVGNVPSWIESGLIFFGGRRWYFVLNSAFGNTNASQLTASIQSAFSNSSNITWVSDAVDIVSLMEIKTPLGLQWYRPDIDDITTTLPLPDNSRLVGTKPICAFCDNNTNPCRHEGVCNSTDGTCACVHKTSGSLCMTIPSGNEHCDLFFNTAEFYYDGGDCCQATCYNSIPGCGGGGLEDIDSAFGENNTNVGGKAHPNCIDPKMVQISIELYRKGKGIEVGIELECNTDTILHLPFEFFDRNSSVINGTQTMLVEDGSDCLLRIGLNDARLEIGRVSVDFKYKVCLGESCENSSTLSESTNDTLYLDGNIRHFRSEFLVSSFWEILSSSSNSDLLRDINSPQGKAIRFESKEGYSHQQNIQLLQRHALLVLSYANGDFLFRDDLGVENRNECEFPLYITCRDGMVTGLDLSNQQVNGSIPSEISLLTTLEHLLLSENSMGGSIPPEIRSLTNLKILDIQSNKFTGKIPDEIGELIKLTHLDLSYNDFHGSIPDSIGELKYLRYLVIESCTLNGTIPHSVGNLTSLVELDLENNFLTGPIPDLSRLTDLVELDLENNALSEFDPESLVPLTKLVTVVVKDNPNIIYIVTVGHELCKKIHFTFYVDCEFNAKHTGDCLNYCNKTQCGDQSVCFNSSSTKGQL